MFNSVVPQHPPSPPSLTTASRIVIVGAGTFGLSTAYHLLGRGYTNVTVLDRATELPAVDAAGTDINKVVRSCYNDLFYAKLAREVIEVWRQPMWQGCYHECGVVIVGGDKFDDRSKNNDIQIGSHIQDLPDAEAIRSKVLSSLRTSFDSTTTTHSGLDPNAQRVGSFTSYSGYFNPEGGWVEAAQALETLLSHVRDMGGKVVENQEVVGLLKDENGRTTGVKCKDGKRYEGDRVILTIGSWTASTFPELELDRKCMATGHTIAMIQLTAEEKERYKGCHIYMDYQTGLYSFPPTEDGIVKLGMHSAGHTHMIPTKIGGDTDQGAGRKISTPRTVTSHPNSGDGLRVPRSALQMSKECLVHAYPELAQKPWSGTRMCWYTDSPDGNWVIGPFPGNPTLFLATSGSGHAFKFLPTIGRLVADSLEGKLDVATTERFAVDRDVTGVANDERASNGPQELDIGELCGLEDLEVL